MIHTRLSAILPSTNRANEPVTPLTPPRSVTSRVIELFLSKPATQSALSQASTLLRQRVEPLLRDEVTREQPSLAEQIIQLIKNSPEPLTDTMLHHEVERRLGQPSAPDPQKTYAQVIQQILESQPPSAPNGHSLFPRSRRDLQNPTSSPSPRQAALQKFADALVESGDRQLAIGVANSLVLQRQVAENGFSSSAAEHNVTVPPDSTFGQAWAELADALHSEPFKSFAEARRIDISKLFISPDGTLTVTGVHRDVNFYPHRDTDWAGASTAVLAAVKKVAGRSFAVAFVDRNHADAYTVAQFYGLNLGHIKNGDTLFAIGQLFRDGTFKSLISSDPLYATRYAPIKQHQQTASQRIADLPQAQLNQRLAALAPQPASKAVEEADRELAQRCSQALLKLLPESQDAAIEVSILVNDIPEYSTFNQVRNNLLDALHGETFKAFMVEENLDPTSVRINPDRSELTGKVDGVDTTFTLNDLSSWTDAWVEIMNAVKAWAAGSNVDVQYPSTTSPKLYDLMRFYNEPIPREISSRESGWLEQRFTSHLGRVANMIRNNGFRALVSPSANDSNSQDVRKRQQAVIQQLTEQPPTRSPLETLAATVQTHADAPVENAELPVGDVPSPENALAVAVHRKMLLVKADVTQAATTMIDAIPAESLFGQWWDYLGKALKARGFTEWAHKNHVDLASLRFDPADNALIAKANGVDTRFNAADFPKKNPEHFDALRYVLSAAQSFTAQGRPITLAHTDNSAPFKLVCNFYGISTYYASSAFARTLQVMGSARQFAQPVENPERIVSWLNRQKTELGDSNDRYVLITQLKAGILNNDDVRLTVDAQSSHQPKGVKTLGAYLSDNGWKVPTTQADLDNLLLALRTPVPQAPPLGNYWGFLSTDLTLSTGQRDQVTCFVKNAIGAHDSLLSYLSASISPLSSEPAQALDQLLSSNRALELATSLQTEMAGITTMTSLKQWLLTALVLDLDPAAGTSRRTVAGFDWQQRANWGLGTDQIQGRFIQHLTDTIHVAANLAPIAAHVLMAGWAQLLLVKEVPQALALGSREWTSFATAVNRIEQLAAGATATMTYQQVMDFHKIHPISEDETRLLAFAQLNPVMDWATINHHVVKNDKDEYTFEQLTDAQQALQKQTRDMSEARDYLGKVQPPNRRLMALEVLKKQYGADIDFNKKCLLENIAGGAVVGVRASIVEAYEAGRLSERWVLEEGAGLDFETLRAKASELPDINAEFDKKISEDFPLRRKHTVTLFKDMIRTLSADEAESLRFGSVEILQAKGIGTGVVLTSDYRGQVRHFAVYPAVEKIVRIPDIPASTVLGHKANLTIDTEAFENGTPPKAGVKSEVILRQYPIWIQQDGADKPYLREININERDPLTLSQPYGDSGLELLASALIDTVYLPKDTFVATQSGRAVNPVENAVEPIDAFKGALRLLPGGSSLIDLYHGEFLEAAGDLAIDIALYAATEGAGKLWTIAKSGVAWAAAKVSSRFIEKFGANEVEHIAFKDLTTAASSESFNSANRLQHHTLSEKAANMADGALTRSGTTGEVNITAALHDGRWYAYDAKTMTAYGPALEDFVSNTSSVLRQETFSDGTQALVTDKALAPDALTLARSHGFDLVNEGEVYRYDRRNPGLLTDLASADHFKPLEGFEAVCSLPSVSGGRLRRGANDDCFSKVIEDVTGELAQELQALEHVRLFPSKAKFYRREQSVIFEQRRFKMVEGEMGPELKPTLDNKRITYKTTISGSIKQEPEFGFHVTAENDALAQNTRVVKLNSISEMCDDKREVRAVIVRDPAGGADRYLVLEADTAEFYFAKYAPAHTGELTFFKCTPRELPLVEGYRHEFSIRQDVTRLPFDANFIALPKLNAAFDGLEHLGYLKKDVDELRASCTGLTEEQQREVVYHLQRVKGQTNIALQPHKVSALPQPADFATWPAEQQNKFYAEQTKASVDRSMKATGLGPGNQVRSKADIERAEAATTTLTWLRKTVPYNASNRADVVLKSGAGNCGEMALLSRDIIKKSGGRAYEWEASGAHVFTVVGGPAERPAGTVAFSGEAWADAWIVDPWAEIACPAREYTQKVKEVMTRWAGKNVKILEGNGSISPLDNEWINKLVTRPKTPFAHGYVSA